MTLVLFHHAVTGVVDDGECLTVGLGVVIDLGLVLLEDPFDACVVDVRFREDVSVSKAIFCDVLVKDLDVVQDFWKVSKAFLYGVPGCVLSREADSSIVVITDDQALAKVRGKEVFRLGL